MKISQRQIGALALGLTIDVIADRGLLHISEDNSVCACGDWQHTTVPLWISDEFVGAARVNKYVDGSMTGRIKIYRVFDLTCISENPSLGYNNAVAMVEISLPERFEKTEENLLAHSHVTAEDEFVEAILSDLRKPASAEVL